MWHFRRETPAQGRGQVEKTQQDREEHKQKMQEFPKGQKRQATDAQQHDCDFVQAMLGQHIGYVINVSNRGDEWHEFCARYWMHLNFKNELDGVSWEWMALTALALGQDVLVHSHQGKHRSGVVANRAP